MTLAERIAELQALCGDVHRRYARDEPKPSVQLANAVAALLPLLPVLDAWVSDFDRNDASAIALRAAYRQALAQLGVTDGR